MTNTPLFIIAHKYYRGYKSILKYYITNIFTFYPKSHVVVVDNNSTHIDDMRNNLRDLQNVTILTNNSDCKFELGAYNVGINHILANPDKYAEFEYTVFTQDNFILKRKYDFQNLTTNEVKACPLVGTPNNGRYWIHHSHIPHMFDKLHLTGRERDVSFCWCNSFILHSSAIAEFLALTKDMKVVCRHDSEACERYFAAILYKLNNFKRFSIDGDMETVSYNIWDINVLHDTPPEHFVKIHQQKTERTNADDSGIYIVTNNNDQVTKQYDIYLESIVQTYLQHMKFGVSNTLLVALKNWPITPATTVNIHINYEHTLVKAGGRDIGNAPVGCIKADDEKMYHVRLTEAKKWHHADIIIDYSNVNLVNVGHLFPALAAKHVYVPPLFFDYVPRPEAPRSIELLTTYIDTAQPRRARFFSECEKRRFTITNVNNVFEYEPLQTLMYDTKILINIHQTDHHHTLEELRVLPALCCGVVVISEDVPLKETIPYSDYIVWTSMERIYDTIADVSQNYQQYASRLSEPRLGEILHEMKLKGKKDFNQHMTRALSVYYA